MGTTVMAQALAQSLRQAMQADERVIVVGEDVARAGGVAQTTAGLLEAFGDKRVIDLPIASRSIIGAALGLAMAGKKPVVNLTSTSQLTEVLEPLLEACSSSLDFPLSMVVRVPFGGQAGRHIDRPLAGALASLTDLQVAVCASAQTAGTLLTQGLASNRPLILLEPRWLYDQETSWESEDIALGRARLLVAGQHITVAAWGDGVSTALQASQTLLQQGISAEVIDLVHIAPLDTLTLGSSVRKTGRLVVVAPTALDHVAQAVQSTVQSAFVHLQSPPTTAAAQVDTVVTAAQQSVFF